MQHVADDPYVPLSDACSALVEAAAALRPVIRGYQQDIERERRIPKPLVEQIRAAGLYRMLVPHELGGLQVDVVTFLRVVELAAEGDGSVGWNLTNNAGPGTLATLSLPDEAVREVFDSGPDVIVAGTIGPRGGRAVPEDGGYRVTGRWAFGSGCQEADWMLGSFQIFDGEQPRQNPDGTPAIRRGLIPTTECGVIDTWDVTGLRGTGSHDWTATDAFVPERRTSRFINTWTNQWSRWPGVLYALPGHALVGPHQSAVATGIARAGIDALTELAGSKVPRNRPGLLREQAQVQEWVGRAEALLGAAQAYRAAVITDVWNTVAASRPPTRQQVARCRLAATYAVDNAMQAMDLMWRAGGTTSIEHSHLLARCWRDVHVVGQSIGVHEDYYPLSGRLFLGLDPGPRLS